MRRKASFDRTEVACVDLFCGAGGLTHGLARAGIPVVAGVDVDKACQHPYETNNTATAFYLRDVVALTGREVQSWFGDTAIRILAGCAPCQPFSSYSNRYKTKGTERWALLDEFARLVREVLPEIVTMENVPTVRKHSVFHDFVKTLEDAGYFVWFDVVDGAEYGLPQRRKRTVLLASQLGDISMTLSGQRKQRTVRQAIAKLPKLAHGQSDPKDRLHSSSKLSALNLSRIKASTAGGTWRDWPPALVAKCHRRKSGKTYPGVYGRMSWDEPAPTLTTQFFGFGSGRFGHPDQHRALSLREGAILQGFPRRYSFVESGKSPSLKVLGRLIGNAVPVPLGVAIGDSIVNHLEPLGPL